MAHFYNLDNLPIEGDIIISCQIYSYYYKIKFKSGKEIDVCFNDAKGASNFYNHYSPQDKFTKEEYFNVQKELKNKEDFVGSWEDLQKSKNSSDYLENDNKSDLDAKSNDEEKIF